MVEDENTEYYSAAYKTLIVPTLLIDTCKPAFTVLSANKAFEELLNIPEQQVKGQAFTGVIFVADNSRQPDWQRHLEQVTLDKQTQIIKSLKVVLNDGATRQDSKYIDVSFAPLTNERGVLLYIIATMTDVTDLVTCQQQASSLAELLVNKEKFLNETQRVARNGTWEIDLATNKVLWSDMMHEIYEIGPDKKLDFETALNFYKDEETREKLVAVVQEAIAVGGVFDIESEINTAKGNPRWIRSTGKADLTDGVCTRLYGTAQDITEKKKIESALIESRNRQQTLIQSVEGIVWEADALTFEFSYVSNQVKSVLGYTPEEWLRDPDFWSKHIYSEDREQAVSFCVMQTKEARNHTFDYRMIKADGSIVWIKDMVSVITENGKPKWLRGIMVDVTDAKLLEELDALEKRVLELNSKKGIDTETVLQEYVHGIEELFPSMKCSLLRVKNNKLYDWVSPSLPADYAQSISDLEIGPDAGSCGTSVYLKEKVIVSDIETDPKWVAYKHLALEHGLRACWSYPVIDSEGEVIAVLGVYYNNVKTPNQYEMDVIARSASILNVILENRLNAEVILEANLLINQGQDLANFGNWQWDITRNIVTWSDVLYKIYGLNKANFKATFEGYTDMLHPDDKGRVMGIIKNVLDSHKDIFFEERIIRPDGEERSLRSWGRVILNDEGTPVKMIGACLDITEAKAAQTKLQEIAWLQSHVIRAPLARLMGLVDILQNELPEHDAHDELLNHIVQTAHELDDVVRNISGKAT